MIKRVKCLFGFHKWKYRAKLFFGGDNRPRIRRRARCCEWCKKEQEFKARTPCFRTTYYDYSWTTVKPST